MKSGTGLWDQRRWQLPLLTPLRVLFPQNVCLPMGPGLQGETGDSSLPGYMSKWLVPQPPRPRQNKTSASLWHTVLAQSAAVSVWKHSEGEWFIQGHRGLGRRSPDSSLLGTLNEGGHCKAGALRSLSTSGPHLTPVLASLTGGASPGWESLALCFGFREGIASPG